MCRLLGEKIANEKQCNRFTSLSSDKQNIIDSLLNVLIKIEVPKVSPEHSELNDQHHNEYHWFDFEVGFAACGSLESYMDDEDVENDDAVDDWTKQNKTVTSAV